MIPGQALERFPARPVSEVEWEEVLVRLELMPRALRVVLEEVEPVTGPARQELRRLVAREESARDFLERAAGLAPGVATPSLQVQYYQEDTMDRFVRVRNRNFALVQRRGLGVWDWTSPARDGRPGGTVYQLLAYLTASDAATLAVLRKTARGRGMC